MNHNYFLASICLVFGSLGLSLAAGSAHSIDPNWFMALVIAYLAGAMMTAGMIGAAYYRPRPETKNPARKR